MTFGTVKVGRLTLTELLRTASEKLNASTRVRSLDLDGQESSPPSTVAEVRQRHADVVAHPDSVVPVLFTDKAALDGYYRVIDSSAVLQEWGTDGTGSDWDLRLERVGSEHEIDIESRLSGPQSRANDHSAVGERIHVPPFGAYAYDAGTTLPTIMNRTSVDGVLKVYRGIPVATHPRWACPLASYGGGRVRFLDADGLERSGADIPTAPTGWQVHNGLVRVSTSGTLIDVAAWTGGAWQSKLWDFRVGGVALGTPSAVTLLRNEYEMVVVRVMWNLAIGRTTADITLRRGYRFAEVWVETQTAATVRVQRSSTEAGVAVTGGVAATANDAAGNRYWLASLRTASTDLANGALFKTATTTFGLAIGAVVAGGSAVSGDAAADLIKQYAGSPSERIQGVRR